MSSDAHLPGPGGRGELLATGAAAVAVLAVSTSAPLIAFAAAPALAIALWRNVLATGAVVPFVLARRRPELRMLAGAGGRRQVGWCVLAGVALAAHFGTWMPSAQLTSVATATALVATQPVWQGLIALGQGRRLPTVTWWGIGIAVVGAALATGADVGFDARAVAGDLLALAGAVFAAVYTAFGEHARRTVSTTTYTTICYGVCAVVLLGVCLVGGIQLTGFSGSTWLVILGLVVGAQLLGHSMFSYALHKIPATTVSVLILLEVPGAALIAWLWLDQVPRLAALPGLGLLLVGVAVVVLGGTRNRTPPPLPPEAGPPESPPAS
ncbi:DMT family transporter [Micromonospora sp. NBC_01813]|uniref:DMT family transporter n=1 Tax=Micromonospora sp. NBC_01813 TaxID=2975988 RepID=UPI002DDB113F|nr:DMT family transporter [Micromonospora sp. NBC_01813]WSA06427.1 DMT family transporter [Micromonospora sp. NBC_01813]